VEGACHCWEGWTGPSCLARSAGAAKTCKPLEEALLGGGGCNSNISSWQCGHGECVEKYVRWDAPQQSTWLEGDRMKPVGNGNGRCICSLGWAGPFCSRQTETNHFPKCVPASESSSPQLETLIEKLCADRIQNSEATGAKITKACAEVVWHPHWLPGGEYSNCGAWPRASWVVNAVAEDKGVCCTHVDSEGRTVCLEVSQNFDTLMIIALSTFAAMALLGCLRQTYMRAPVSKREANGPAKKGNCCSPEDTDSDGTEDGSSDSDGASKA